MIIAKTSIGKNNVNISGFLLSNMKDKNFAYSVIKIDNNIKAEIKYIYLG